MGKRPVRRPVEEDIADDDLAALAQRGVLARQRRRLLREHKRDTADRILESIERRPGVAKLRNPVVVDLGHQDLTSLRLLLFSLLAPTVTVGQDVFAWVPCPEHTSPPPFCTRVLWLCVVVYPPRMLMRSKKNARSTTHAPVTNTRPCARAFEEEPRTKNCQERLLSNGPSFWMDHLSGKYWYQKCIILFEKMDELRGQPRFHDVSVGFLGVFAGLAALGFGAGCFAPLGQWSLRCCNNTSCRGMDEDGRKRTPEK